MTTPRTPYPMAIMDGDMPLFHVQGTYPPEYARDEKLEAIWGRKRTMQPYYQDNKGIVLYHGDCLDVMPRLDACSFDAVICDPPYGTTAAAWDSPIPFAPMWACLKRLARTRAAIAIFGSEPFSSALRASNFSMFKYDWIWEKSEGTGFLDAAERPLKYHEIVSVFGEKEPLYYPQRWQGEPNHTRKATGRIVHDAVNKGAYFITASDLTGDKYPRSVLHFPIVKPQLRLHTNQKPLALVEYLIKTYTNEGDTVLDFTSGSGTTLRACKNLGRACVGIERELPYCEATVKRLAPAFEAALVDEGVSMEDLPMFAGLELFV